MVFDFSLLRRSSIFSVIFRLFFFVLSFFSIAIVKAQVDLRTAEEVLKKDEEVVRPTLGDPRSQFSSPAENGSPAVNPEKESFFETGNKLFKHGIGVGLGETFLLSDFRRHGEDKITMDLMYNYLASHSFDLVVDGHYSRHRRLGEEVTLLGLAVGIKAKIFQFDAFSPFVVAGPGFYRPKVTRYIQQNGQQVSWTSQGKIVFGTHLGIGGDLMLNQRVSIGLLGQYHNPFDVKQTTGPEVEGSYFKFLMTLFMYY
jgi:hypothetical protein